MFEIQKIINNEYYIFRDVLLDLIKVLLEDSDETLERQAEETINEMFCNMIKIFLDDKVVHYKNTDEPDEIVFKSINQFKVYLIKNQWLSSYNNILKCLNEYCLDNDIVLPRLNIIFGDNDDSLIFNTDMYFNNSFRQEWLEDEVVGDIIKDVDKSKVINGNAIESPVFGIMPVKQLSGGVKTLILIYNNPEKLFNASTCGDNCAKWIERIAEIKDYEICLYHAMPFTKENFQAYIVNEDTVVNSYYDYIKLADKYCRE